MKNLIRAALAVLVATSGTLASQAPASAEAKDPYTTPGTHTINGRNWRTACEKYSVTTRCRTEIEATIVTYAGGRFTARTGWAFNNPTYLPSPRSAWKGNPLGNKGEWTAQDGRKWRTECDTAVTGRGGCRSYAQASVIAKTATGYAWRTQWVFNSMTRFTSTNQVTAAPRPKQTQPPRPVTVADPALLTCLRKAAGLGATQAFTTQSALKVTSATCYDDGIRSVAGIEHFTNLVQLGVTGPSLTDASPVSTLTKLDALHLTDTAVTDLRLVARLRALTILTLNNSPVRDLSPLAAHPSLQRLDLSYTDIRTVAPLQRVANLVDLNVSYNPQLDPASVGSLTRLVILDISGNDLDDLTSISSLELGLLTARDNWLTSLRGLNPASLHTLYLEENAIEDLRGIGRATQLSTLSLAYNPLVDLSPLTSLSRLTYLDLAVTDVSDLRPLAAAKSLRELTIDDTFVTDVRPLAGLSGLKRLFARETDISDWSPLNALRKNGLSIIV